ncbi:hypothetical protein HO173_003246 [Letharia columbiana]|uniref:DUF7924 domain-containing protein n=1 Tax=Letharia columbiana TaxID=112416 RepID=A0A8H6L7T7_9LECA|nr:uncharacterized protein HO173_003246 [Letharia columbiana]KAF6238740.1 hypothetical protein HO173_003246 [Letharia columbiana]
MPEILGSPLMPGLPLNGLTSRTREKLTFDATVSATHTPNTIVLGPEAKETDQEDLGADTSSFAFSISWSTHVAKIHVHWCEVRPDGIKIYHMNLIRAYLLLSDKDVSDFRGRIHNVTDYSVGPERKRGLEEL